MTSPGVSRQRGLRNFPTPRCCAEHCREVAVLCCAVLFLHSIARPLSPAGEARGQILSTASTAPHSQELQAASVVGDHRRENGRVQHFHAGSDRDSGGLSSGVAREGGGSGRAVNDMLDVGAAATQASSFSVPSALFWPECKSVLGPHSFPFQ